MNAAASRSAPTKSSGGYDINTTMQSLFLSIPDVNWQLVASFAAPPDVYNLSLSSKQFFRPTTLPDTVDIMKNGTTDPKRKRNRRKNNKGGSKKKKGTSSTLPLLATRLLRESLLYSLARVLEHSKSGITLDSALALGDVSDALIAGSTMAQACLGVLWDGSRYESSPDVDIFCSAQAAPEVRSVSWYDCLWGGGVALSLFSQSHCCALPALILLKYNSG